MRQWTHDELHALIDNDPNLKAKSDKVHALPQSSQEEREQGKLQMMEIYAEAISCKQVETAKAFITRAFVCMKQGSEIKIESAEYLSQKKCHAPLGNNFVCFCDKLVNPPG